MFRASGVADGGKDSGDKLRSIPVPPRRTEAANEGGPAATEPSPKTAVNGGHQGEIAWPDLSGAIATLQLPNFAKTGALEGHGGSAYQEG